MKIIKTVSLSIQLTRDDVEQAVVDFLPKRFTGMTFLVCVNADGTADLESKETK